MTYRRMIAAAVLAFPLAGTAQEAPPTVQEQCHRGRLALEALHAKLTDLEKKGLIAEALDEIAEIEEDSAWSVCVALVEETLKAVE